MGIKKIARPINKAKNTFLKWLKDNNAECVDVYGCQDNDVEWDYYVVVSGFIGENIYMVYFMIWNGELQIDYTDEENRYSNMNIDEFLQLIK